LRVVGDNTDPGVDPRIINGVVSGPSDHIPVMLNEVLSTLQPLPDKLIVDGTFGAGGYSRAILEKGANVLAIDRDANAQVAGKAFLLEFGERFQFFHGEFEEMDLICERAGFDSVDSVYGVVLDVGVSSMQIDDAERGFSFQKDGPLDMRMGQLGLSASDLVNKAEGKDLTRIIGILGEERHAGRVSRAIVAQRDLKPITRTLELANLVEKTLGRKYSDRIHPATRTFQALRIFVNRELEQLANGLFAAERILNAGGQLVIVTFHSLEDRIVKQFFADRCGNKSGSRHLPQIEENEPSFNQSRSSAIKATIEEAETNPRARSAKLRWATRTSAPSRAVDMKLFGRQVSLSLSGRI
jgi:16S rRNA (cytosine1402-N4)-methyltransferase